MSPCQAAASLADSPFSSGASEAPGIRKDLLGDTQREHKIKRHR